MDVHNNRIRILLTMAKVKHGEWFLLEINGQEYRAKWNSYGFTYSTLRIEKEEIYTCRKYLFFGSKITKKRWSTVVWNSREDTPGISDVQCKYMYYDAFDTRRQVQNIVLRLDQEHSKRI